MGFAARRPFYETSEQRAREDAVALFVAGLRNCAEFAFPPGSSVDRVLIGTDGAVRALLEIKTRTTKSTAYPTYSVSLERATYLSHVAARLRVPAIIAIDWTDCLGLLNPVTTPADRVEMGGRTDRQDEKDIEPMLHWRIENIKKHKRT